MYLARFELDQRAFHVAAADLGARPAAPLLPLPWRTALLESKHCDFALRFGTQGGVLRGRLVLSVEGSPQPLQQLLAGLAASAHPAEGLALAASSDEFDRLTGPLSRHQVWLNQRGYVVGGEPVAADYRLLPLLDRLAAIFDGRDADLTYQINLRRYVPGTDETRAVRKYLAALQVEPPFPAPLTALESTIAGRLLHPAFLTDEILVAPDEPTLRLVLDAIGDDFEATMAPFGFVSPPLEQGGFDELLVTGRHSSCFDPASHFLVRGAGAMPVSEVGRLLGSPPPALGAGALRSTEAATAPPVFLSYSSKDFIEAVATCRHLEAAGIRCWIAPRNVLPGEAYPEAIMKGIETCRALVVLLSDTSNLSPHVHREIERALSHNAVIIPLRLLKMRPTGAMEYLISACQWIDAFGPTFDSALDTLLARLRGLLG